jgi:hypothetical protein
MIERAGEGILGGETNRVEQVRIVCEEAGESPFTAGVSSRAEKNGGSGFKAKG